MGKTWCFKAVSFSWGGEGCLQTNQKPVSRDKSPCLNDSPCGSSFAGANGVGANHLGQVRFFFHMTSLQGPVKYWSLFIFSGIKETTNTTDRYYVVYVIMNSQPENSARKNLAPE